MDETADLQSVDTLSGSVLKVWLLNDLSEARQALEAGVLPLDKAIHLARRRLKRVRSLLRVVKSIPGSDTALPGAQNRAQPVIDAFRLMSGARDMAAMLAAAEWLANHTETEASRDLVDRLRGKLDEARNQPVAIQTVVRLLRIAETDVASLADAFNPAILLRQNLVATYRKGRQLYRRALDSRDSDDETLHDWRKRVKHRMHLGQIIGGTGLLAVTSPLTDLDRLAEYLGDEHDLANLAAWISADPALADRPQDLAPLTAAISRRRVKLTNRALDLGHDLYGQRTERFARELG